MERSLDNQSVHLRNSPYREFDDKPPRGLEHDQISVGAHELSSDIGKSESVTVSASHALREIYLESISGSQYLHPRLQMCGRAPSG